MSVAEGLLAGNINILKLPSADKGLSIRIIKRLCKYEPLLSRYIYVFDTPSSDVRTIQALAGFADGIVVWGGTEAVKAVRSLAPPGVKSLNGDTSSASATFPITQIIQMNFRLLPSI